MSAAKAYLIIFTSALGFAILGGLIGYGLGRLVPNYYRSVYERGHAPGFDPVQVGLGLGITQGLAVGLVIGTIVVLAVAFAHRRRSEREHS